MLVHSYNSNLEFYCTANIGTFTYDSNVKNITIQGQDDFSWYPDSDGLLKAPVYIDIIVKKNNNNYGYCIISIDESDNFEISGVYENTEGNFDEFYHNELFPLLKKEMDRRLKILEEL